MYVLELSSFQLAHSRALSLASAALLNVSDDHKDWHGDFAQYKRAKNRVYLAANHCVGSPDSELEMNTLVAAAPPQAHQWGVSAHGGDDWLYHGQVPLLPISELPLTGHHNVENCLWAMALVEPWIKPLTAAKLLSGFQVCRMVRISRVHNTFAASMIRKPRMWGQPWRPWQGLNVRNS